MAAKAAPVLVPPKAAAALDHQEATILAHETVNDEKRFTVYKVEIASSKGKFIVYRRCVRGRLPFVALRCGARRPV